MHTILNKIWYAIGSLLVVEVIMNYYLMIHSMRTDEASGKGNFNDKNAFWRLAFLTITFYLTSIWQYMLVSSVFHSIISLVVVIFLNIPIYLYIGNNPIELNYFVTLEIRYLKVFSIGDDNELNLDGTLSANWWNNNKNALTKCIFNDYLSSNHNLTMYVCL